MIGNDTTCQFIAINGTQLQDKYYGESARLVRDLFERARKSDIAIIFIDEIDSIGSDRESNKSSSDQTLLELLNQMDGFSKDHKILVIGATNLPNKLDAALIRSGRLDCHVYIGAPDVSARKELFRLYLKPIAHDKNIDLDKLAQLSDRFSCADIEELIEKSVRAALRAGRQKLLWQDFEVQFAA